ncbi:MAG: DUF1573 domain-containing protein [Phaeodactylibacter sp.]|nr:DUF1573 domain-containing protein [Phaeodactylibacter sp.]MCB9274721.1 DUF1573 domain-containing protein [Lewinellaceae bacterium]
MPLMFAQNTTAEPASDTGGKPVIAFETMEIDYGTIPHNGEPYREFKFTNTGDAPLIISNARGSCGCTVPEWPKEPIMPGQSNVIKVRYATDRIGKFSKTVTLTTNDDEGQHVLRIKGEVLSDPPAEGSTPAPTGVDNQ